MVYEVELWAFCNGAVRKVDIEDRLANESVQDVLENVFYWGQNEHQEQDMPSVSVGDVCRVFDDRWLCCSVGWKELKRVEYIAYTRMSQTERILKCLCHQ